MKKWLIKILSYIRPIYIVENENGKIIYWKIFKG